MNDFHVLIDLFPWSIFIGILISCICSILGVFVILKRMVFISIALSEAAALGISVGMILQIPSLVSASVFALVFGLCLSRPYEIEKIPRESILGIMFAGAGALSILIVSKAGLGMEEVKALLYGDLILTQPAELITGIIIFIPIGIFLYIFRKPIIYTFLDREAAFIMGIKTSLWETLFFASLSMVIAASSKAAGSMLVFAFLIISPSCGLILCRTMKSVIIMSALISVISTLFGLYLSLLLDFPSNQLIIAILSVVFLFSYIVKKIGKW